MNSIENISPRSVLMLPTFVKYFGASKVFDTHKKLVLLGAYPKARSGEKASIEDVARLLVYLCSSRVKDVETMHQATGGDQTGTTRADVDHGREVFYPDSPLISCSLVSDLASIVIGAYRIKKAFIGRFHSLIEYQVAGEQIVYTIGDGYHGEPVRKYQASDAPDVISMDSGCTLTQSFFDELFIDLTSA